MTARGPGYQLVVPEGWARSDDGASVRFTDKFNAIAVKTMPTATAPTVASAQAVELPALSSFVPCFSGAKVSAISRRSGPVLLITYQANSAADPVTGKSVRQDVERYEFWRSGTEAVVTLSSPAGSDNVDPWRKVTDSFAWTS